MQRPNILIPMAGLGSRFFNAGYDKPKPLIDVNGIPMIQAVVESLGIDGHYIFIIQDSHDKKYGLSNILAGLVADCTIVKIDEKTEGAACTTLMAKHFIDNSSPLLIANSDQVIVWDSFAIASMMPYENFIALFQADDPKWSYAKIQDNLIIEVAEKQVISNNATVGVYGWTKGSDYVKYAEQMINKNIRTNNEFYVCPVYNEAIQDGARVIPYFVDSMHGIGTPEDLEEYLRS